MMERMSSLLPSLPIALSIICLTVACSAEHPADSESPRPVKTQLVTAGNKPTVRSFPGKVEASKKVDLSFQVPGVVIKQPGKEGNTVAKGEVISQLRQDEFQARVEAAQGQLNQARATLKALESGERSEEQLRREAQLRAAEAKLENTRTEFERYTRLLKESAVSRSDYDLAETAYRVAQEEEKADRQIVEKGATARKEDIEAQEAVVRGLEGKLAEADLQLSDATLRAPYDGIIAQRLVDEGQNVSPRIPVVKFQSTGEIDIVADVPETFMATEMRSATILEIVAEFTMAPGREFPVQIKEATQVADPKTQTFQIRTAMKPPSGFTVLPGMTATITIAYQQAGSSGNRILVPVSAVTRLETGPQVVWVIGRDQVVHPQPVKAGAVTGGVIEIVEGLQSGERIVVAGVDYLRDGMKVHDLGDALGSPQL
jgi:multidrug efflux system membrane fusion protein